MDKRTKEYKAYHAFGAGSTGAAATSSTPLLTSHTQELDSFERLKSQAIPCYYARFHQPVPPGYDKEPVSEFKVKAQSKYSVESMLYHPTAGLIFEALNKKGEHEDDIIPASNIIYVRV